MADAPVLIKRYPNRRYYAHNTSAYVSLLQIEEMVQSGVQVEIRDSQSGADLTQAVLTQIIMDRHPEKMSLFPTDMLHLILRSNGVMLGFLGDYFRHSLTYLNYLQRHGRPGTALPPVRWVKAWLDRMTPESSPASEVAPTEVATSSDPPGDPTMDPKQIADPKQVAATAPLNEAEQP